MGSRTDPEDANGLWDWILDRIGVVELVRTGKSGSRLLQPMDCIESRNEEEAIAKVVEG